MCRTDSVRDATLGHSVLWQAPQIWERRADSGERGGNGHAHSLSATVRTDGPDLRHRGLVVGRLPDTDVLLYSATSILVRYKSRGKSSISFGPGAIVRRTFGETRRWFAGGFDSRRLPGRGDGASEADRRLIRPGEPGWPGSRGGTMLLADEPLLTVSDPTLLGLDDNRGQAAKLLQVETLAHLMQGFAVTWPRSSARSIPTWTHGKLSRAIEPVGRRDQRLRRRQQHRLVSRRPQTHRRP